jgi:hypothetical protein
MPNRKEERTYRNIRRSYHWSRLWQKISKALLIKLILAFVAIVISSVSQFITSDIKITYFAIFFVVSLAPIIWAITSVTIYHINILRFSMLILLGGLCVCFASIYLCIKSPRDIKDDIFKAFSTNKEQINAYISESSGTNNALTQSSALKIWPTSSPVPKNTPKREKYVYVHKITLW